MKKLLVFDANSILNRAFYGVRPLTTKSGLHTNAVYGYINIITKHMDSLCPDCVACAFDLKVPTFRHKMYSEYKAGRHAMPEELKEQIPYIKAVTEALGIKMLSLEGYEADDILGTLSQKFEDVTHTYIVTGDRDSLQLVSPSTTVILATTGKDEEYTPEKVFERYLVSPEKLIDIKALMGDSSDNIPGVLGIGEKTAVKLISENESLDTLYERLEKGEIKLSPSVFQKLSEGKESAYFSRSLATICKEVPLNIASSELVPSPIDKKALAELFRELEFTRLMEKFKLETNEKPLAEESLGQISFDDMSEVSEVTAKEVTSDTFVLCDKLYLDLDETHLYRMEGGEIISTPITRELLCALSEKELFLWDSKAFWHKAIKLGADVPEKAVVFDVKIGAYVENPDTKGDFKHILMRTLAKTSVFSDSPLYRVEHIEALAKALINNIEEIGAHSLYYDIELPLTRVLANMEERGFCLDTGALEAYGKELSAKISELEAHIHTLCGETFNINSPKQLGHILFERLELPVFKKKKSGYSTDAETLEKLRPYSPVIDAILEYRKLQKLNSTYAEGLLKVVGDNGRIHTDFKQTGTLTGRLSSAEPNLQNIPVRTEEGSLLRKFFTAGEGCALIDADYSQIELRLLAHMAEDEVMISAFNTGEDIHTVTASKVFKTPIDEVTPALRTRAKAVNFGIVYGIGAFSLSEDLHISQKEAREYIQGYFDTYQKVKLYLDKTVEKAMETGYVETLFNRRRFIPELSGTNKTLQAFGKRVAMNTPIQGTAADIIKLAMVKVARRLEREGLKTKLILQVHDELILEAPENEAETAAKILKEEMENTANLSVLLKTDVGIGKNWLEAKN